MVTDPLLAALLESIEQGKPVALATVVVATGAFAEAQGKHTVVWLDQPPQGDLGLGSLNQEVYRDIAACLSQRRPQMLAYKKEEGTAEIFVEVQRRPPTLLIVGAGHIARPLAQLGKLLNFYVVVLDDRPQYANKRRFPMADEVLAKPFQTTLREWPIDADTYIVLVTRGHSHDVDSLLEVIDSEASYIGMLGSKRRVRAVFELLEREKGIDPDRLRRVYAPIGLDLGAETPEEISISIIAEIVKIYRGGRAASLSDAIRADRRLPLHPHRLQTGS